MGHGKAFSAVYAEGGICGISPRPDRIHPLGSYVYVVPVATIVKIMFHMRLCAISGYREWKP
eukprot:3719054-Pleurochrysis_carterae.AAC.1